MTAQVVWLWQERRNSYWTAWLDFIHFWHWAIGWVLFLDCLLGLEVADPLACMYMFLFMAETLLYPRWGYLAETYNSNNGMHTYMKHMCTHTDPPAVTLLYAPHVQSIAFGLCTFKNRQIIKVRWWKFVSKTKFVFVSRAPPRHLWMQ